MSTPADTGASLAPRRQRAEQQRARETRAKILQAAVECLVEVGLRETTTVLIQQRAGVSRGSLLHHFGSRESLLVAASQHLARGRMHEMAETYAHHLGDHLEGAARVARAVELMWVPFRQPYFWAAVELWVGARNDPALRDMLAPQERSLGATIREVLDQIFGAEFTGHPNYPDLRELLFTSMRGVALAYALDSRRPENDPHLRTWKHLAYTMLDIAPPDRPA